MGSRHRDEAFGDPYELPPDRAYTETCAAIASVMLAWRLLLATGEAGYADAIERAMYNGVLSGHVADRARSSSTPTRCSGAPTAPASRPAHGERAPWYACACCPPNLMRLLSSWQQYLATGDDDRGPDPPVRHATSADHDRRGPVRLAVRTDYPWQGRVTVHIVQTPDEPWTLSLRVPRWCGSRPAVAARAAVGPVARTAAGGRATPSSWTWTCRSASPSPTRGSTRCAAASPFERGPLVYCVESADLPAGVELEDCGGTAIAQPVEVPGRTSATAVVGIESRSSTWLARRPGGRDLVAGRDSLLRLGQPAGSEAMRVWIPR